MRQQEFLELADRYLNGQMDPKEKESFELLCDQDPDLNALFLSHAEFVQTMKRHEARAEFKSQLEKTIQEQPNETIVVRLWKKLKINAVAAAAVAVLSSLATLYSTGYFSTLRRANSDYSALKREINSVKRNVNAHHNAIRNINKETNAPQDALQFGATGFMLTKDGYVVTNFHVVNHAKEAEVTFRDGVTIKARGHLARDHVWDLVVLEIPVNDKTKRPELKLAKSLPRKGETIVALGAPRGFSFTASDGIVSGLREGAEMRQILGDTFETKSNHKFIQMTAPISPGNSGGPLINLQGEVVGVNTFCRTDSQNLNFAVAAEHVAAVLKDAGRSQSFEETDKFGSYRQRWPNVQESRPVARNRPQKKKTTPRSRPTGTSPSPMASTLPAASARLAWINFARCAAATAPRARIWHSWNTRAGTHVVWSGTRMAYWMAR